jgi:hypothetical protein
MVRARLNGFVPPNFQGSIPPFDARKPPAWIRNQFPPIDIRDARELQSDADSEAAFFADNGFVLLGHETKVGDWSGDVCPTYFPEIEAIIRDRLFLGRRVEVQQDFKPNLRGHGTGAPQYGLAVHADVPVTPELYAQNVAASGSLEAGSEWLANYRRDDVAGFIGIDFWRPINMRQPLRHMPLAICAPGSVEAGDILPISATYIVNARMTNHLALRFNPQQRWYFYPGMTGDEVLAFKMVEFWKDDPSAHPQCVFHSAFADPGAPAGAERRQSCEHRVGVLILRDSASRQG